MIYCIMLYTIATRHNNLNIKVLHIVVHYIVLNTEYRLGWIRIN